MILEKEDLKSLCAIAIQATTEAGALINNYAGRTLHVEIKNEALDRAAQVVTEVDRLSQDIILKYIKPTLAQYDLGLLCEESEDDGSRFEKDYFWCIDPLDGTLPFIERRPGYAVSIALVSQAGVPVLGVVYEPPTQTLYHAIQDQGAFCNQKPWQLEQGDGEEYKHIDQGGAVMNACWVLTQPPAYFHKKPKAEDGGGCLWDYAATACLCAELGAWMSDIHGKLLDLNCRETLFMNAKGVFCASDKKAFSLL